MLLKREVFGFHTISFSQAGEDVLLWSLFDRKKEGFFIDVGAHHPKRYSNTYLLYRNGWRGINIDPVPNMKKRFDRSRPQDINLNFGISKTEGKMTYHCFNEPGINTFSEEIAKKKVKEHSFFYLKSKIEVQVFPLRDVLEKYLPQDIQNIDFLNVDTEGHDLEVLKSNDFKKFRPKMVLAEALEFDFKNVHENSIVAFMTKQKYEMISFCGGTLFFKDKLEKIK